MSFPPTPVLTTPNPAKPPVSDEVGHAQGAMVFLLNCLLNLFDFLVNIISSHVYHDV